jgi:type IV pilus assembly protein PilA
MDRFYKMMKRNNKGFTLVELMVVLLILGILVAIAIPIYNKTQESAAIKAHEANIRTLISAGQMAIAAEDVPKTDDVTWTEIPKEPETDKHYWAGDYIKEWPDVPTGLPTGNGEKYAEYNGKGYQVTISTDGDVSVGPKIE